MKKPNPDNVDKDLFGKPVDWSKAKPNREDNSLGFRKAQKELGKYFYKAGPKKSENAASGH